MDPSISIVIPCRNDAEALAATLDHLGRLDRRDELQTIVAAWGDEHRTAAVVGDRATLIWPGGFTRAELLNAGAAVARAPVLLFLHADSHLPTDAIDLVQRAFADSGVLSGAFEHHFVEQDWRLLIVSLINRVRYRLTRNYYGDQAPFVRTGTFHATGGFRRITLMEDLDLSQRLKRLGRTALVRAPVRTSGRRFLARGPFRTLAYCGWLLTLRACGADVERSGLSCRSSRAMRVPRTPSRLDQWLRTIPLLVRLGGAFVAIFLAESCRPLRREVEGRTVRVPRNLAMAGLGAAAVQLAEAPVVEPLCRILVTPRMHGIHHSIVADEADSKSSVSGRGGASRRPGYGYFVGPSPVHPGSARPARCR